MLNLVPVIGAPRHGNESSFPQSLVVKIGSVASWIVLIMTFIFFNFKYEFLKDSPVPVPPIPGTFPEHQTPSQILHKLQKPFIFSLAFSLTVLISILKPPYNSKFPLLSYLIPS